MQQELDVTKLSGRLGNARWYNSTDHTSSLVQLHPFIPVRISNAIDDTEIIFMLISGERKWAPLPFIRIPEAILNIKLSMPITIILFDGKLDTGRNASKHIIL